MSAVVCPSCSRPVPPPLLELPALVLDELDREGPNSASTLARRLHRRKANVLACLHELSAAGLVRLDQLSTSPRSRLWTSVNTPGGTEQEPRLAPSPAVDAVSTALACLSALTASDRIARVLALAAGALLVAAVVVAARRGQL